MCEVLDKVEARGKFSTIYNFIKKGRMTLEEEASDTPQTQTFFICRADYGLYFVLDCFMLERKNNTKEIKPDKSGTIF